MKMFLKSVKVAVVLSIQRLSSNIKSIALERMDSLLEAAIRRLINIGILTQNLLNLSYSCATFVVASSDQPLLRST